MNWSKIILIFLYSVQFGCVSQKSDTFDIKKQDQLLAGIYDKFYENRHDYGASFGEARDTILIRFRNTLKKTLRQKASIGYTFPLLSEKIDIEDSKDKNIRIFSWDELNGGTWHIYNSMYQVSTNNTLFSGNFVNKDFVNSDVTYFKINKVEENKYLAMGYGTHGAGEEFYIVRLLHINSNNLSDCNECFDGKDQLVFIRPRGTKDIPVYDETFKTIRFPEFIQNEETGFLQKTQKMITLQYENETFILTDK